MVKSGMRAEGCIFVDAVGAIARRTINEGRPKMSPLRQRMIEDMTLAGLAAGTQTVYIQAVR